MQTARLPHHRKGVHVDLIKLYGSMELARLVGLSNVVVDLVSTGRRPKANDLVAVEEIMSISSRLVVDQAALRLDTRPSSPSASRRSGARSRLRGVSENPAHANPCRTAAWL